MIAYAIEAALASGIFDHIVVSTDDTEIASVAVTARAEMRRLSVHPNSPDDFTPTVLVIAHAILACRDLGWPVEQVCCAYAGVPFIEASDLIEALRLLETGVARYVFPVTPFPSAVQRALRRGSDGKVATFNLEYVNTRTPRP